MQRLLLTYVAAIIMLLSPMSPEIISCGTSTAFADEMSYDGSYKREAPSAESIICDVVIARPLGVVTMAIGAVFFVVSLPFGLVSGSTALAERALVAEPFNFTFTRPLGEFDSDPPGSLPADKNTNSNTAPDDRHEKN